MGRKEWIEAAHDLMDAVRAEEELRREIRLTTNKTPEMLAQYAKRVPLKDHEQLLLEAWKDAAEYTEIARGRLKEFECSTWNTKGGEEHEREA